MSPPSLRGARILTAGGGPERASGLRERLAEDGAELLVHAPDIAAAVAALTHAHADAVVVLDEGAPALLERLDPLGTGLGLALVSAEELADASVARHLGRALERHSLRTRVTELQAVVAAQAVNVRHEADAADRAALRRLAVAADYRDDNTPAHTQRVGHLAALLGRRLGLGTGTVAVVRAAAPLHDVGKIAIPDSILLKPDRLGQEEYEVVKTHAAVGARILGGGGSELLEVAQRIARSHHERWDGTGYPDGLAEEAIPLSGRLAAVADVFDVLLHERPYKEEWSLADAAEEIRRGAGTQFDPQVVEAFDALGERAWTSRPR